MSQITVNAFIFIKLKQFKLLLSKELDDYDHMEPGERGSEISWNAVFTRLLVDHEKIIALESKVISQNLEIHRLKEGRGDEMKDLLEKSLVKQPIYIQAGAMSQSTITGLSAPPEPPKLPSIYVAPISQNIKDDLKVEIKSLFDGSTPKPSLIKKAVEASEDENIVKQGDEE